MFPSVCLILFASVLLSACSNDGSAIAAQSFNIQWQNSAKSHASAVQAALRAHDITQDEKGPIVTLQFSAQPLKQQQDVSFSMQRWQYCLKWQQEAEQGHQCLTVTHLANELEASQEQAIDFLVLEFLLRQSSSTASMPASSSS